MRAGSVPPEIPFRSSRASSRRAARQPGSQTRTALAHRDHRMLRKRTFGAIPECAGRPSGSLWNHLPLDNFSSNGPFYRSEEHTSELQSLMRISYAVFCLKKKTNTNPSLYYPHYLTTQIFLFTNITSSV